VFRELVRIARTECDQERIAMQQLRKRTLRLGSFLPVTSDPAARDLPGSAAITTIAVWFCEPLRGQLTPAEGQQIAAILEGRRRVIETEEHEARIRALESGR